MFEKRVLKTVSGCKLELVRRGIEMSGSKEKGHNDKFHSLHPYPFH